MDQPSFYEEALADVADVDILEPFQMAGGLVDSKAPVPHGQYIGVPNIAFSLHPTPGMEKKR